MSFGGGGGREFGGGMVGFDMLDPNHFFISDPVLLV
jgi:hypothetical protein